MDVLYVQFEKKTPTMPYPYWSTFDDALESVNLHLTHWGLLHKSADPD